MLGHMNELTQQRRVKKPSGSQFVPLKNGIQVCLLHRIFRVWLPEQCPPLPQDFHTLGTCTCVTIYGKRNFADVIKFCNLNVIKP